MPYVIQCPATGFFYTGWACRDLVEGIQDARVFPRRGDAVRSLGGCEPGEVREVALTLVDTIAHAEVDEWLRTNPAGVAPGAAQP